LFKAKLETPIEVKPTDTQDYFWSNAMVVAQQIESAMEKGDLKTANALMQSPYIINKS
tara:strand:- start:4611 stop:4784 length:174 start_codon:yes stop_codon:yes gene_type:complete